MSHNPLRRHLIGVGLLAAGLLLVGAGPAGATTITPGSTTYFNFNFTGQVPPPPYASIDSVLVTFANVDPGDMGNFNFFDGLNGTGPTFDGLFSGQVPTISINFLGATAPESVDGIFSLRVLGTAGTYDISVVAVARSVTGATVQLTGVPVTAAVPEPATMVLVALGMGGAALRRRRQK